MKRRRLHKNSNGKRGAPLGQHFLTSTAIASAVAAAGSVMEHDEVLEIGPGRGILTEALLKKGARVTAVEKDPAMIEILKREFAREIKNKTLVLHEQDIRDLLKAKSLHLQDPYKVIANIPYYITGELIRLFLTAEKQPAVIAFLVQKEVAERIVGNSKKESILSLSVKVFGTPRYVKTVKRGSFSPAPSVDSAILSITDISRKNFTPIYGCSAEELREREKIFFKVVKAGFAQKRKTLAGNLKRVFGERALGAMKKLNIPEKIRAEDVPLPQWLSLAESFMT